MPPSPPAVPSPDGRPSPTVSVVIPALNEAHSLPLVLGGLPPVDEVIVVDGGSADDTVRVARRARPDAVVLRQTRSGKGNALACGFAASTGDIVVTLNGDGSTDPGEIPRYVDALLAGAEVAHGSRYGDGGGDLLGGRLERLGNATLSRLVNTFFDARLTDLGSGYNAYWRGLLPALDLPGPRAPGGRGGRPAWGDGPEIEPLVNIRMAAQGLRVVEVASVGYPSIDGDDRRRLLRRAWRALHTFFAEYLRRWRRRRSVPARHQEVTRRHEPATRPSGKSYPGMRSSATDTRGRLVGERTTGRHARASNVNAGQARRRPMANPRPESLADTGAPPPADRRRGYPGPRPPWAGSVESWAGSVETGAGSVETGGAHRTQDIDRRPSVGAVYDTGVHRLDPDDAGTHRSALYDTGVHRVGTYDSGVHRTDVYESGLHRQPENEDGPLYRQGALREVGGGRRRLDAQDRGADGRPDLTVLPGEGDPGDGGPGDGGPGDGGPDHPGDGRGHLRAVPGERHTR
jgi:glycosyltransferase involved in cell wall biosynthesis